MLSIKDYLKRLAARLTTANGDVSAVPGESICDVLDFMVKNLNVDSTGALIVSKIIKKIVLDLTQAEEFGSVYYISDEPLGLTYGKSYTVNYKVDGVEKSKTVQAEEHANGKVYLAIEDGDVSADFTTICDRAAGRNADNYDWNDGPGFTIEVGCTGRIANTYEFLGITEA